MRILLITDRMPYPPVSGNLLRVYSICSRLARAHEVWLATPVSHEAELAGLHHMEDLCSQVITGIRQHKSRIHHIPGLFQYAWQGKPLEYKFEHCEQLVRDIRELTANVNFDVVHIEPSYMGLYVEALHPGLKAAKSLSFHNVESSLFRQLSQLERIGIAKWRQLLHSTMLRRWEATYLSHFDACITVSESDRALLSSINPAARIVVMPNGFDTKAYQPLPAAEAAGIIFVGSMNYSACADAATYFCHEVLPYITDAFGPVDTWLVGRDPTPEVRQLAQPMVHVTGWVENVVPYYARSSVCVVPLRAGGGTKLKILEAMALGRPIVTTPKGAEGLDVVDGTHLFIATTAQEFAQKTVQLLNDPGLRQQLTDAARALVVARYDWDAIAKQLADFYTTLPGTGVKGDEWHAA